MYFANTLSSSEVKKFVVESLLLEANRNWIPWNIDSPFPFQLYETLDDEIETIPGGPVSLSTFPMNVNDDDHPLS